MNNDKIRQRVQNVYAAFVTDVDPNRLSDYLKQEGIISIEQWQDICGKNKTTQRQCRALLDFLLTGNDPRAFVVVRTALEKQNHYLLGKIDDESTILTEDKKTIKRLKFELQTQVEMMQMQEKSLQEAKSEIDKLRKRVAELEFERAKYHLKEKMQSTQTHSNERPVKRDATEEVNQKVKDTTDC